ncbi:peptidoglycan-binding protein [Anaerotignum sp.]|uniref:peptidoglycan-binding domain-containing protein n=1 Tax=Anaerotignum sp. TaxID=2039241 RepID=UPI00332B37D2
MQTGYPFIPESITVHLGNPNEYARNVTVPFIDYIKNVASSEIYPTWPERAIRANIYAQISYALNRIYAEHYRKQGYDFDISNSPTYDQNYIEGREIFDSISNIVDDIFDSYIVKQGSAGPFFAQYCNGTTTVCDGLSQWGTVYLAESGYIPYDILRYYYGDEINIETDVPVGSLKDSYPGFPLKLGSSGSSVKTIKVQLERIRKNYPEIPKITSYNDLYDMETEKAVKEFQRIFNLTADGVVGKGTWYKLKNLYNSVNKLGQLASEALTYEKFRPLYEEALKIGSQGIGIKTIQYMLTMLSYFDPDIPEIEVDGFYGPQTESAVIAFQTKYGIPPNGIVDPVTWKALNDRYVKLINSMSPQILQGKASLYPGYILSLGTRNKDVENLQTYLATIAEYYPWALDVEISGYFDNETYDAVKTMQRQWGLKESGVVGANTWLQIATLYDQLITQQNF